MALQNHSQSFSHQDDTSLRPTQGALLPTSFSPGAQPASASYNPSGHPSNDAQDHHFTHPMSIPWQTFQNDQTWMPGQTMGVVGPALLIQDWELNPHISMTPLYTPSRSNPRAIHGHHHSAGVPLGMSTVEHR
jgi:hypothetical protein